MLPTGLQDEVGGLSNSDGFKPTLHHSQQPSALQDTFESEDGGAYTDAAIDGGSGRADSGKGYGGGGHGNDGSDSSGNNEGGSADENLPQDVQQALAAGVLSADALARYYSYARSGNPLMRLLIAIPSFRTRVLADSAFFFKLLVQELIGNGTGLASEIAVRGKDIVDELEYVASDLIVGTVVEAAFVWLLAPRVIVTAADAASASKGMLAGLGRYLESLPANAFEQATKARAYTIGMRGASFVYAGLQYAAIGMVAGVVGTAITYALLEGRKLMDPSYKPMREMPPILANSAGWAAFMALSSNTRFQVVEGMERGLHAVLKGDGMQNGLLKASIIALRFGNNYWGGVQFVKFFRFLGLHEVAES